MAFKLKIKVGAFTSIKTKNRENINLYLKLYRPRIFYQNSFKMTKKFFEIFCLENSKNLLVVQYGKCVLVLRITYDDLLDLEPKHIFCIVQEKLNRC